MDSLFLFSAKGCVCGEWSGKVDLGLVVGGEEGVSALHAEGHGAYGAGFWNGRMALVSGGVYWQ